MSSTKILATVFACLITSSLHANINRTLSICDGFDDRQPSDDPKIARTLDSRTGRSACTLTMISRSCAISAGHCQRKFKLQVAEFHAPMSDEKGRIEHSKASNVYDIDQDSIVYEHRTNGNDYAIMKLFPNEVTGRYPGDVQGFYNVATVLPKIGEIIRITGFGRDADDKTRSHTQQTHTGEIIAIKRGEGISSLTHVADTKGGSSGSAVLHEKTGEIIAIHTNGGCSSRGGANSSTLIVGHTKIEKAIAACLASEK